MRPRQLTFFKTESFAQMNRRVHGGAIRTGKRKLARPFDPKKPIHIVLRSSKARAEWSFLRARNERRIKQIVYEQARRSGVRVYQYANSGNHLHLLLKAKTRDGLARFLRAVGGLIARAVTGAKKGRSLVENPAPYPTSSKTRTSHKARASHQARATQNRVRSFWDALAFSRIVEWGREFIRVRDYLVLNELEGLGWNEFSPRKRERKSSNAEFS